METKKSPLRTLSVLLTVAVLFGVFACLPVGAETLTEGDFEYTVENGEATITKYNGDRGNLTIPSTLGGYPVTTIGRYAFYVYIDNYTLANPTSVTIPDSVKTLEEGAFKRTGLTSVTIPANVTEIGEAVFGQCSDLKSIAVQAGNPNYEVVNNCLIDKRSKLLLRGCNDSVIPNGVKALGANSFSDCQDLANVTFPASLETIGEYAFWDCYALTSITIPASVKTIVEGVFGDCTGLKSITVESGNPNYEVIDDCLIEKKTGKLIGSAWSNSVIPDGVKVLGTHAFSFREIKSIVIPDSVTEIKDKAFRACSALENVYIPENVTKIGEAVFDSCSSLKSVFIPKSVTEVGKEVFEGCEKLTVYCEAPSKPEGWDENWAFDPDNDIPENVTVVWGYQPPTKLGDVNGDGTVNAGDYMMLKRHVLRTYSLNAAQLKVADINGDNDINASDYMMLKRAVLGTYKLPTA